MKSIKLPKGDIKKLKSYVDMKVNEEIEFPLPKYSTQIYNLISSNAQATRPKYVGQMSEIVPKFIKEFHNETGKFPDWKDWKKYYLENHSDEYNAGKERLREYVQKHKEALEKILNDKDEILLSNWYDKFILIQNFKGFQYEEFVFLYISRILKKDKKYSIRKATPSEESKGIDIVIEKEMSQKLLINVKPFKTFDSIKKQKHLSRDEKIIILYYDVSEDEFQIRFENNESFKEFDNF